MATEDTPPVVVSIPIAMTDVNASLARQLGLITEAERKQITWPTS